ncbi:MAG: Phytochrome-like protein cph2 [Syntrophus sp. PtaU1.Bin208]|nr:MAG: Phytochrome-like protein cph2 [Syntrophus sp. PtaU1.Bin208]
MGKRSSLEDRREVQAALNSLSAIVDTPDYAIISMSADGAITSWNTTAEKLYGYTSAEMIGSPAAMLLPEDRSNETAQLLDRICKGERIEHLETVRRRKDGSLMEVSLAVSPIRDGKGIVLGASFIVSDISRYVQTEQKLKQSEERYRTLFQESKAVMLILDPENGQIIDANESALRFYGYRREEFLAKSVMAINTLKSEEVSRELKKAAAEKRNHFKFRHRLAGGQERDVEVYASPFFSDGKMLLHSIVIDITDRIHAEAELIKLSTAVEQSPSSIVITDRNGFIQYVNPKFIETTGYSPEEVRGHTPAVLKSGRTTVEEYRLLWKTILSGQEWRGEFFNRKKNGAYYWERAVIAPIKSPEGSIDYFVAIKEDISEQKAMEESLRQSEEHYRLLADNSTDMIWAVDRKGRYTYVSPSVERLLGHTPEEFMNLPVSALFTDSSRRNIRTSLKSIFRRVEQGERLAPQRLKIEYRRKDGTIIWMEATFNVVLDGEGRLLGGQGASRDITERKKAEAALRRYQGFLEALSITDGLTGVANRRRFDEYLENEWRRASRSSTPLSLLLVDIDDFKKFNDHYGHIAGDDCLRRVAGAVASIVRRPGDLVCRYGGEEFACVLPQTTLAGAVSVASLVVREVEELGILHERSRGGKNVTISCGVATMVPRANLKSMELIRRADALLYEAKNQGRNRVAWAAEEDVK